MNYYTHRFLYKPDFLDLFPPDTEVLHDGEGVVTVILPDAVVTIKSREAV